MPMQKEYAQTKLYRTLGEHPRAEHHRRVRGVGATRDRCNHHAPVRQAVLRALELELVDDMQTRKRMMLETADAIVTLPGGSGTFEELFDAITSKRLGIFTHPLVILNQNGFYDPLFRLLESSVAERFMHEQHLDIWHAVDHVDEVLPAIESAEPWPADAVEFATR